VTRACVVLLSLGLVLVGTATFDAAPPAAGFGPDAERAAPPRSAQSPGSDPAADALAEFPQFDRDVLQLERAARAIRAASLADHLPDSLEKLQAYLGVASATYREQSRITDALRTAGAVIENRPADAARALELLMTHAPYDGEADTRAALPGMLAAARDRIGGLPQDRAAELAYQANRANAWLTRKKDDQALQAIVRDYAGTEAALQAELDLLESAVGFDPWKRADAFARFAEEHPGTCAAASALRMEANDVGSNQGTSGRATNPDPTDRVLRALAIAGKLDSPPYKACRPRFSTGTSGYVFASKPTYAPGNIDRIIAAYRAFLPARLDTAAGSGDSGIGYLVLHQLAELFGAKGEGADGLDRFLAGIEKDAADPDAVRYLRALAFESLALGQGPADISAPPARTVELLTGLHETAKGLYGRKSLATLAWLQGFYGTAEKARALYAEYATRYPDSPYAWVAALRAAECASSGGDWKTAATEYRAATSASGSVLAARVLAHVYAGRALEALDDFAPALAEYRRALDAWDRTLAARLSLGRTRRGRPSANAFEPSPDPMEVTRLALEARVSQLARTLAAPGGAVLELGRWLVGVERRKDAVAVLSGFATRFPRSANLAEAQYLAHKARLYDALELLNVEGETNEAAGMAALEALARESYDFPVTAAKIAQACVMSARGRGQEAESLLRAALAERVRRQPSQEPATPLEKDVAAIRSLLFLPTGGAPYSGGQRGWNGFRWPSALPPFVLAGAATVVKDPGGKAVEVTLYQRFPDLDNVVLLDADGLSFFATLMNKVGGTKKRAWTVDPQRDLQRGYLETPNQPVGPSVNLLAFLNTSFPARAGHWGGWEFLTYPHVGEIQFADEARTKGRVRVTIGYSGCTVLVEKQPDGTWKATGMTDMWVT
jgi:hypothetical protein